MYKVFVNEKKLSLTKDSEREIKSIHYDGNTASLEMAIDILENTATPEINIYHEDMEQMWKDFSRIFFNINAAGGIVENDKKEVLFIKRLGKWDLPKGKAEKNESFSETALREITEETGLSHLKLKDFLSTTYHIYTERKSKKILKIIHWFSMTYSGSEIPKPQLEEGITEVSWKTREQIRKEIFENTFKNIELLLKDFGYFD